MTTKSYMIVSTLIFALVALMHLIRITQGWPILLGTMTVPLWVSVLALLVFALVALWGISLIQKV